VVHGATVGDTCIIGMNATVLDGAVIGNNSIVGAGALVTRARCFQTTASSSGFRKGR
jgi:carbonic anhydrase/acetyltransferase-like protein (isoleucine patch superfamily)